MISINVDKITYHYTSSQISSEILAYLSDDLYILLRREHFIITREILLDIYGHIIHIKKEEAEAPSL